MKKEILITIGVMVVLTIVVIIGLSLGNETPGDEIRKLSISEDFVTEVNLYSDKEITKEELEEMSEGQITTYENLIFDKTGYKMSYGDKYCKYTGRTYLKSLVEEAPLDNVGCFYGEDDNILYFIDNYDVILNVYQGLDDYYKADNQTAQKSVIFQEIQSVTNPYFKILLILSSPMAIQVNFFNDNSLIGGQDIIDIEEYTVLTPENNTNEYVNFEDSVIQRGTMTYVMRVEDESNEKGYVDETWHLTYAYTDDNEVFLTDNEPEGDTLIKATRADWERVYNS